MLYNYENMYNEYSIFLQAQQLNFTFTKHAKLQLYTVPTRLLTKIAPSSLLIMNLCLRDINNKKATNYKQIHKLTQILSDNLIWLEGYSYWKNLKPFLEEWEKLHTFSYTTSVIKKIDLSFWQTSYNRQGVLYPAPFGNLKNEPLEENLQSLGTVPMVATVSKIIKLKHSKGGEYYHIYPVQLGLNTALPYNKSKIRIIEGYPLGFTFYKDEYTKYTKHHSTEYSSWLKIKDTFRKGRVCRTY